MLSYQSADKFFEHCLVECGLLDGWSQHVTLAQFKQDDKATSALLKTLQDIRSGADVTFAKGKPNENPGNLSGEEWERHWNAWAASRRAAFYSRASLFLLGDSQYFKYFVETLRTSHNIVFQSGANDVLQHATGHYLNGPEEDLGRLQLAEWWDKQPLASQN